MRSRFSTSSTIIAAPSLAKVRVIRGLRYKSQALMGVNKIYNETGVPDETQIDGEGALVCPVTQV